MEQREKNIIAQQVIGKMQMEPDFFMEFKVNPNEVVKKISEEIGKKASDEEIKEIKKEIEQGLAVAGFTKAEMLALFNNITKRVDDGYRDVQNMSRVLFWLGILIIASVFLIDIYGLLWKVNLKPFLAGSVVLGGIGIGTIYEATNKLPDKVKNSVADVVQIKVAFIGYWDQLSVLMGVTNSGPDDAARVVKEISTITEGTMKRIQGYCEAH